MFPNVRTAAITAVAVMLVSSPPSRVEAAGQAEDAGAKLLAKVDLAHAGAKTLSCDFEVVSQEAGRSERTFAQTVRVKGRKARIEFTAPADMKGTKLLILGPAEWYVYLPSFGKIRRIASHTKMTSFLGSSFAPQDYFFNTYSDDYSAAVSSDAGKEAVLLLTPKPGRTPEYAKIEMTVAKEASVATLLKYFDEKGTLLKTETRSEIETQGGIALASQFHMVDNLKEGQWTKMTRKSLKVDEEISDDLFTKAQLDR